MIDPQLHATGSSEPIQSQPKPSSHRLSLVARRRAARITAEAGAEAAEKDQAKKAQDKLIAKKNQSKKAYEKLVPSPQDSFITLLRHGRNKTIASVVAKALDHPKLRHLSDRALALHLNLDHKTVGTWRRKLRGELPRTRAQFARKIYLAHLRCTRKTPSTLVWRSLRPNDFAEVRATYEELHRVLFGASTLPDPNPTQQEAQ
jgi:hypothetical protein